MKEMNNIYRTLKWLNTKPANAVFIPKKSSVIKNKIKRKK